MTYSPYGILVDNFADQREVFFKFLFGEQSQGYVCIAFLDHATKKEMDQYFFEWPKQLPEMLAKITKESQKPVHSYFCPIIFSKPARRIELAKCCPAIWADLDKCNPLNLAVKPNIIVESSPGRWQGYWTLTEPASPEVGEDIARRIAYNYKDHGADTSGWDLTQLLRIPFTLNHKYQDLQNLPMVNITEVERKLFRTRELENKFPQVGVVAKVKHQEIPDVEELDPNFLDKYPILRDDERFASLYYNTPTPDQDWSTRLWTLELICFEAGLTDKETFQVVRNSACNKYKRDGRGDEPLWKDVTRARIQRIEKIQINPIPTAEIPDFISEEEIEIIRNRETYVERYIHWASTVTDASVPYHQAGAFMSLSGLLSGNLELKTSFGIIRPNMWFWLIGDTTLSRKTTAMNLAMKLTYEVNEDAMFASDGSVEGIFSAIAERPRVPSIFQRDEFHGFIESMLKKDYMAGVAEQLTKLYDGDRFKRLLRKETIDVEDPIFLMFVGGVKTRTQMVLTEELISGGFLPRFVMICGEPDLDKVKDIGPPNESKNEARELLVNELQDMFNHYTQATDLMRNGRKIGVAPKTFNVVLTDQAWKRFNYFSRQMTKAAIDSKIQHLIPMYDRLSKSILKAAILIAASLQRDNDMVIVDEIDIVQAIYYGQQWREHANVMVAGVGRSLDERLMNDIVSFVRASSGTGITRAALMRHFRLDVKRADLLFKTLEMRQEIFLDNGKYYVHF